jgi:hypothetical protein
MPGFAHPGVLFAGNSSPSERRFYKLVISKLRDRGYTRLVEPCAGAFALSLVATECGWPVGAIESSDVSLYAGVLGAVVADTPLEDLGVKLDGELVELPDKPKVDQAAWLLWLQLALRLDTRPDVPYWENLKKNVRDDQDRLLGQIGTHVRKLQDRLEGIRYESLDMFEHAARVADDPHTVVVAAPPTYNAGMSRRTGFSTRRRVAPTTWTSCAMRRRCC